MVIGAATPVQTLYRTYGRVAAGIIVNCIAVRHDTACAELSRCDQMTGARSSVRY